MARVWLDVPYEEKDAAKARGARWDPQARRWYAPWASQSRQLDRWKARPDLPEVVPGEDRAFGSGLFVDLVPSTCWFTNARSAIAPVDWERTRRMVLRRVGDRCEVCHRGPDRDLGRHLAVHERWAFDERRFIQHLRRLICLCSDCHLTTHMGFARVKGKDAEATQHLCTVTGMSSAETEAHIEVAFELWGQRSQHTWKLDLSCLTGAGIEVVQPPAPDARAALTAVDAPDLTGYFGFARNS